MLSPEVQKRLDDAREQQTHYQPKREIIETLGRKSLIMFVGPVATGKTFIMDKIVDLDPSFAKVPVFTTRESRPDDDPAMFRTVPHDDQHVSSILDDIADQEVVQYTIHPTTGRIYGSLPSDYPADYNMLPTLSGAVEQLQNLPFDRHFVVCLATKPDIWEQWLRDRYPIDNEEKQKRLYEALVSLDWLLENADDSSIWAHNIPEQGEQTAKDIIAAILYNQRSENAIEVAKAMRQRVKEML